MKYNYNIQMKKCLNADSTCSPLVNFDYIKSKNKEAIWLLVLLLLIIPFINIFGCLGRININHSELHLKSYMNYISVIICFIVQILSKKKITKNVINYAVTLAFLLIINYLLTDYASVKWFFNWLGFIYISAVIMTNVERFSDAEVLYFQKTIRFMLIPLIYLFMIIITVAIGLNLVAFKQLILQYGFQMKSVQLASGNYNLSVLASAVGIEKQAFGTFVGLLIFLCVMLRSTFSRNNIAIIAIMFVLLFPFAGAVRTLTLSMALVSAWFFLSKNVINSKSVCFIGSAIVLFLFSFYYSETMVFVEEYYDRIYSLRFALYTLRNTIFGLGNGGYSAYVDSSVDVLSMFGSDKMLASDSFWLAPESDLVYFIASWGVLCLPFFAMFLYALNKGGSLCHLRSVYPIEKIWILLSWMMIFMGISQDNAGGLVWWIFMSFGFGVLFRHQHSHNMSGGKGSR